MSEFSYWRNVQWIFWTVRSPRPKLKRLVAQPGYKTATAVRFNKAPENCFRTLLRAYRPPIFLHSKCALCNKTSWIWSHSNKQPAEQLAVRRFSVKLFHELCKGYEIRALINFNYSQSMFSTKYYLQESPWKCEFTLKYATVCKLICYNYYYYYY